MGIMMVVMMVSPIEEQAFSFPWLPNPHAITVTELQKNRHNNLAAAHVFVKGLEYIFGLLTHSKEFLN